MTNSQFSSGKQSPRRSSLLGAALAMLTPTMLTHAPASAQTQLNTLQQGIYECGLPGDATGKAWKVQKAREFRVITASSYQNAKGKGTYLLTGSDVVFTRGPMKDMRMTMHRSGLLQETRKDGSLGPLRCHRMAPLPN
jgi:hypothetical protein